jgi:group I intron endonuclease
MCKIYVLVDPDTLEIRYIGQTINSVEKRLQQHIGAAKRGKKSYLYNWIRKLLNKNKAPKIITIQNNAIFNESEKYWIQQYRNLDFNLLNLTDGGEGNLGWKPPIETRHKMSRKLIGNKRMFNKKHSAETKKKMSLSHMGKPHLKGESNPMSKLSSKDVQAIKELYDSGSYTQIDLSKKFNISRAQIGRVLRKEQWI